jgi:hypothetical protein
VAAARSAAWIVFARTNTGIVGSNSAEGMDVCIFVRLFCVHVIVCVDSSFVKGRSPVQGIVLTLYKIKKLQKQPLSNRGAVEP